MLNPKRRKARLKKTQALLEPSSQEKLIQNVGRLFYKRKVEIPRELIGKRSLFERGYARKNKNGKLVFTDKGMRWFYLRFLEGHPVRRSTYGSDRKWVYTVSGYLDMISVLKKRLGEFKGKKILELGFREPDFLGVLKERGAEVSGLESYPFRKTEGLDLVQGNAEHPEKYFGNKKFDAIFSKDLFEPYDAEFSLSGMTEEINVLKRNAADKKTISGLEQKLNKRVLSMLKRINGKLEKNGYFITQTMGPSFIKKWHLKREGFEIVSFRKTNIGNYILVAKKI